MDAVVYIGSSRQLIGWAWNNWRSTKREDANWRHCYG